MTHTHILSKALLCINSDMYSFSICTYLFTWILTWYLKISPDTPSAISSGMCSARIRKKTYSDICSGRSHFDDICFDQNYPKPLELMNLSWIPSDFCHCPPDFSQVGASLDDTIHWTRARLRRAEEESGDLSFGALRGLPGTRSEVEKTWKKNRWKRRAAGKISGFISLSFDIVMVNDLHRLQ